MKPDFLSPDFHNDPFPVLEWFRSNKPVCRHEETAVPCVSVFKYADVRYVCRNDNDFSFQGIANHDKPLVGGKPCSGIHRYIPECESYLIRYSTAREFTGWIR